jgi:hypothetical protein
MPVNRLYEKAKRLVESRRVETLGQGVYNVIGDHGTYTVVQDYAGKLSCRVNEKGEMLSRNSGNNPHKDEKEAETTPNQTLTPQAEILIKKRQLRFLEDEFGCF